MPILITLTLLAQVPFIGHADHGRLFCNAACVVEQDGAVVLTTSGPVNQPLDCDRCVVRAA